MNQFIEVKKSDFETTLDSFVKGWTEGRVGNELTYNLTLPNGMVMVVYSSISFAKRHGAGAW